jgi:vacuolar iron transporter family protein
VRQTLREHGLDPPLAETVTAALTSDPERWINFMMCFELGLEEPEAGREFKSALTISGAYVAGGLLPLAPYILLDSVFRALLVSVALTLAALLIFGAVNSPAWRPSAARCKQQLLELSQPPPLLPSPGSSAAELAC